MPAVPRRVFLAACPISLASAGAFAGIRSSSMLKEPIDAGSNTPFYRQSPLIVKEFVGSCHFKFEKVQDMLKEDPGLAKVSWDWGFGDVESGIGAASHTGQIQIIELLLAHGARPDIFTMATLDKVDAVRSYIESVPEAKNIDGPHGISLYSHASSGKALKVMEYLESKGITSDNGSFSLDEAKARPYTGTFASAAHPKMRYVIEWSSRWSSLNIQAPNEIPRGLTPTGVFESGQHEFRPAGSRGAIFKFISHDEFEFTYSGQSLTAYRVTD